MISDFLPLGPGIWWEQTSSGFEFYDGDDSSNYHDEGPLLQHYRLATLPDVLLLLKQWYECLKSTDTLPAYVTRFGKTHRIWDLSQKIEFDTWLIS